MCTCHIFIHPCSTKMSFSKHQSITKCFGDICHLIYRLIRLFCYYKMFWRHLYRHFRYMPTAKVDRASVYFIITSAQVASLNRLTYVQPAFDFLFSLNLIKVYETLILLINNLEFLYQMHASSNQNSMSTSRFLMFIVHGSLKEEIST